MNLLERRLSKLVGFPVKVEVMEKVKKEDFWGYALQCFITDGEEKLNKRGTIRVNGKVSDDKLVKVIIHETQHLSENGLSEEDIEKAIEGINIRKYIRRRESVSDKKQE